MKIACAFGSPLDLLRSLSRSLCLCREPQTRRCQIMKAKYKTKEEDEKHDASF